MQYIDVESWDRKAHFALFQNSDLPYYNTTFDLDITGLPEFAKAAGVSFNATLIHVSLLAMNGIENLRYRFLDGKVVLYDRVHPSFTHMRPGETLFRLITLDHVDDLRAFSDGMRKATAGSRAHFDMTGFAGRSDFAFFSSMPDVPFTSIDHTLSLNRQDGIPKVTWGRYGERGGRTLIPYNIQVNHSFVDGYHIGLFYEALGREVARLLRP